jgi:hypothetical protein
VGRFSDMERLATDRGLDLAMLPADDLDELWERAKAGG